MPIDSPSYGDRTPETSEPSEYVEVSTFSLRDWAVAGSQRRVATVLKSVWPLLTTRTFLSMYGCRMLIAPLKKNVALLSSGEPANSSTFHGFGLPEAARPSSSELACRTP